MSATPTTNEVLPVVLMEPGVTVEIGEPEVSGGDPSPGQEPTPPIELG